MKTKKLELDKTNRSRIKEAFAAVRAKYPGLPKTPVSYLVWLGVKGNTHYFQDWGNPIPITVELD